MWRAWETKEQNLARGVPPEQMGLAAKSADAAAAAAAFATLSTAIANRPTGRA